MDDKKNQQNPIEQSKKTFLQKPIRTYESDLAEAVSRKKSSVINIAVAENERRESNIKKASVPIPTIRQLGNLSTQPTVQSSVSELIQKPIPEPTPEPIQKPTQDPVPEPVFKPIQEYTTLETKPIVVPIQDPIAEEQNLQFEIQSKKNSRKKFLLTITSLIFILGGIFGGYYLYKRSPLAPVEIAPKIIQARGIIATNSQKSIFIASQGGSELLDVINHEFSNYETTPNTIFEIILKQNVSTTTINMSSSTFIEKINLSMPDILKRALTDKWMLGGYYADEQKLPFIIFKTDFFQNAFAGMLKWESLMPDSLAKLLNFEEKARFDEQTSTSTLASSYFTIRGNFEDRIIKNRDVREFRNKRGEILFLYSFIDKDTLIITTSEATLSVLIDQIEKQTYIR